MNQSLKFLGSNRSVHVRRRVGKRAATPFITSIVKHERGSVIVLEAFANCKVRDLHQLNGKVNQTGYHRILQHHAIPSGTRNVGQVFVFMQDYDPKHTRILNQWYTKSKEEHHILQLMSWPTQSADLNPFELV